MEVTVWELLAAAQAERKAKLDAGRVDTLFKVGDRFCCGLRSCSTQQLLAISYGPLTVTVTASPLQSRAPT